MSLDAVVDRIVRHLRDCGPATFGGLSTPLSVGERVLDRALQKARRAGLIEHSKAEGDSHKLWRLVGQPK